MKYSRKVHLKKCTLRVDKKNGLLLLYEQLQVECYMWSVWQNEPPGIIYIKKSQGFLLIDINKVKIVAIVYCFPSKG